MSDGTMPFRERLIMRYVAAARREDAEEMERLARQMNAVEMLVALERLMACDEK